MSNSTEETLRLRRTDRYPEITRLDHERYAAHKRSEDASLGFRERSAADLVYRQTNEALNAAKQKARDVFAAAHGWSESHADFTVEMLRQARGARCDSSDWEGNRAGEVLDHCSYYRAGRGKHARPEAIVSHTYTDWAKVIEFAAEHNLNVEALPGSWYYPGGCIAALFTRKPGVIEPRPPGRDALGLELYGEHSNRDQELHDEIATLALSAKAHDKASLRLLKRLSRLWAIHCATSRAQRDYERDNTLYAAMLRLEDKYDRILSVEFLRENPAHAANQEPAARALLEHRDSRDRQRREAERARQEQAEYLDSAPPRGVPTKFHIDHTLESPANVRKARRLDLEGHEWLCIEEHARWALEWARETDRLTTEQPVQLSA